MRNISVFFVLFLGISLSAQVSIKGIVLDSSTKYPVPYSLILTDSHKFGVIANEKGEFELTIPDSLTNDNLEVSCIGYDTTIVSINLFLRSGKKEILVNHKSVSLPEFTIISIDQDKLCKSKWGIKGKPGNYRAEFNLGIGSEMALFIPNISGDVGIISSLKFFVTNEGNPTTPFRAKLYRVNPEDSCPGELIIDQQLIVHPKRGNRWVEIDISSLNIEIPHEGFFVAMEWLPDSKLFTETIIEGHVVKGYGMNMGGNQELQTHYTWTKSCLGNWKHFGPQPPFSNINAMIGADVLIKCK